VLVEVFVNLSEIFHDNLFKGEVSQNRETLQIGGNGIEDTQFDFGKRENLV